MSAAFSFHSQLVSIMDALSKTAVLEISKLVELESKMLRLEITRGRSEIAALSEKLLHMEKLLFVARGHPVTSPAEKQPENRRSAPGTQGPHAAVKRENPWEKNRSSCEASVRREEHIERVAVKQEDTEGRWSSQGSERGEGAGAKTQERTCEGVGGPKAATDRWHLVLSNAHLSPRGAGRRETIQNNESLDLDAGRCFGPYVASRSSDEQNNSSICSPAMKKFVCPHCGKSFRCFSQLEIHQRSHTGEKPYRCALCGKRYAQKGHLYTHQRTHTGEKPYRCPVCGKGFVQKCTLDMHQRTHTGERPFVCGECGKGFTKNCNLKKHLAVHKEQHLQTCGLESRGDAAQLVRRSGAEALHSL